MQEGAQLHGLAEQPTEWLTAGVLEDEDGAALVAREPERPNGPSPIELGRECVFVLQTRQGRRRNVVARGSHNEHTGNGALFGASIDSSIQDELSIRMERLKRAV
jgi:hypothetical protein